MVVAAWLQHKTCRWSGVVAVSRARAAVVCLIILASMGEDMKEEGEVPFGERDQAARGLIANWFISTLCHCGAVFPPWSTKCSPVVV